MPSLMGLLVVVSACGGGDAAPSTEALSTEPPAATSAEPATTTATTTTTPATTTTTPATTTTTTTSTTTSTTSTTTSTTEPAPAELATPDEFDLTVFFRLAESVLTATDSPYAGTDPDVLVASAQASCLVLLAGGDVRSAIEAAIEASPVAGQPFGAEEQQLVLLVVTRGVALWCPGVVDDEEAFTSEVISTVVDVFFDS